MKVDFFICTNSDLWCSECVKYIDNLIIPENVEIEVACITNAAGMAAGYEAARSSSTADYKVYLHQDTFIINRHFIKDIDDVFRSNEKIGVIGMLGNNDVENQSISWGSWRWGKVICNTGTRQLQLNKCDVTGKYQTVDCLDGMILVTRYDIPWREDILDGWHFYDRSICMEYRRKEYLCVVPRQESPWCIHACGIRELGGWNDSLFTYLNEYQDFFVKEEVLKNMQLADLSGTERSDRIADQVEALIDNREMDEAIRFLNESIDGGVQLNKRLVFLQNLLEIWETGKCNLFFMADDSVSEMQVKYTKAYFFLQRKFYELSLEEEEMLLLSKLTEQEKSVVLQHELTEHNQNRKNAMGVLEILKQVRQKGHDFFEMLTDENTEAEAAAQNAIALAAMIGVLDGIVPSAEYEQYSEFFAAFSMFCRKCGNVDFLLANVAELDSSLELFIECIEGLYNEYMMRIKRCPCCDHMVMYLPLPDYYGAMRNWYHISADPRNEMLDREEYICPDCGACDRDRLIISFLKKEGLQEAPEGMKLLQIAPAASISKWVEIKCPHIKYDTTDLYMDGVSFRSDIMDMHMVPDETYDVIICSHVLEHVQDDRKALSELKRILKPDGKIVFLAPIDVNASGIDEEWGLSEAENWRRFGQGDRCRRYDKAGLLQRLEEQFYVHSLGMEYFGEELFEQGGLMDTSTLYVLTLTDTVNLNMAEEINIDEKFCIDGPLVSVLLPCYNHEQFVAEAIESVINQSYKNIEIIVADDGSTDNTAAVVKRYSSYFKKATYFAENEGGRYKHLRQYAEGKYIALMHSDDVWEKDKLALQVAYMESHAECGCCLTWCTYTDEELNDFSDPVFIKSNRSSHEWMRYFWMEGNALCNPSSLTRCEINIELKRRAGRQSPDFFKWIEFVQTTSIHVIPKALIRMRRYRRKGQENTSISSSENKLRYMVEEGCGWLGVIRNMDPVFFKKAFAPLMRNPAADTKEEIQCEKFFLMLNHRNPFVQSSAMCYFYDIFDEVKECMEKEYHYTKKDFAKDMVDRGMAQFFQEEGRLRELYLNY